MDSIIFLPSAGLGLLMVGWYIYGCTRGWRRFDLAAMVNVVLYSSGAVAGVLLVAGTFLPNLRARLTGFEIYTLIGGLAVFAVSGKALIREVFSRGAQRSEREQPAEVGSDTSAPSGPR